MGHENSKALDSYVTDLLDEDGGNINADAPAHDRKHKHDREYLKSLPPGYRFAPKDEELIHHYLIKKVKDLELPPNNFIDQNIYEYNPAVLAERYREYGEKEWYFFTPRTRKYLNGGRPNRQAGDGYWKATGSDKAIVRHGITIGFKKSLVFYKGNPPDGKKTNWIMQEYMLPRTEDKKGHDHHEKRKKNINNDMSLDKWVMCRIYAKYERSHKGATNHQDADANQQDDTVGDNVNIAAVDPPPILHSHPLNTVNPNDHQYDHSVEEQSEHGAVVAHNYMHPPLLDHPDNVNVAAVDPSPLLHSRPLNMVNPHDHQYDHNFVQQSEHGGVAVDNYMPHVDHHYNYSHDSVMDFKNLPFDDQKPFFFNTSDQPWMNIPDDERVHHDFFSNFFQNSASPSLDLPYLSPPFSSRDD